MCGIAGLISSQKTIEHKEKIAPLMINTLKRRGPDEGGVYMDENALLLHRRLAVVDIENGRQPMEFKTKDEHYILVYNGELYNTEEVKKELIAKGYSFSGHSDTEVVLKAYAEFGEKCAEKFNGIFAFAVFECLRKRLFLCRDRIGVKPLFYALKDHELIFGSEIKTILKSGLIKPEINKEGLFELFFLGPARSQGVGVFKGISELKPGEYAYFENGNLIKKKYFEITAQPHTESEAQTLEHTKWLIEDAIKRQLVSDVPLCTFLSGGLDSSIITNCASKNAKAENRQICSYSVEYRDNDKYFEKTLFQPNRDADFIDLMVRHADTKHFEVIIENEVLAEYLRDATLARDLPGMADVDSSLLLFCKEVKKNFTVALSGECADEIFGGYPWYHREEILFEDTFPWSRSLDIRRSILKDGILKSGEEYVRGRYLDTVNSASKLSTDSKLESRMREMFMLNFNWFMQCLLDRKDRMSMYSGLEVRVPFCDYRIVEYAYNMPWNLKALMGREKGIVRKAFEDDLPREIVYRKKSPYPKTHNPFYFKTVSEKVRKILEKKSPLTDMLCKSNIENIMENPDSISDPWYGQLMRAPQILAYIVQLDTWFEEYNVDIIN
ncbi:MAG: asparagine synthase (glutamine-hydrolyzing) [Ruminococcaceae bacterium]|nr:asparagine synthase (glutamine-hydrolyzing) [Oscillospiraceae bacterium]